MKISEVAKEGEKLQMKVKKNLKKLIPIAMAAFLFTGCASAAKQDMKGKEEAKHKVSREKPAKEEVSLIDGTGKTLEGRIKVPKGYKRTAEKKGSLGDFLRKYKVMPDNSPILLYDGREKDNDDAACVFRMHLGDKDLQQCADSVIRVYAEYMRKSGRQDQIAFHFVNGFTCDWNSYRSGKRIAVNGNRVGWRVAKPASDSQETFEGYLETVFNYASTLSLEKESRPVRAKDIRIGDIFIKGGSPGHVVMVVDTCEKNGKRAFLLAQGYMPAQQFHVLRNDAHREDPWYYQEEVVYPFRTPEFTFYDKCLRRPEYLL